MTNKKTYKKTCNFCPIKIDDAYNLCYTCNRSKNNRPIIQNCFTCQIQKNNIYKYCSTCYKKNQDNYNLNKGNVKI